MDTQLRRVRLKISHPPSPCIGAKDRSLGANADKHAAMRRVRSTPRRHHDRVRRARRCLAERPGVRVVLQARFLRCRPDHSSADCLPRSCGRRHRRMLRQFSTPAHNQPRIPVTWSSPNPPTRQTGVSGSSAGGVGGCERHGQDGRRAERKSGGILRVTERPFYADIVLTFVSPQTESDRSCVGRQLV